MRNNHTPRTATSKKDTFKPSEISPLPWSVREKDVWHSVVSANGKTVCNCRNILDARSIADAMNRTNGK